MCYSITAVGSPPSDFELKINTYPCNRNHFRLADECSCSVLTCVENINYLGVQIDNKLNWSFHIAALASRIRRLIYVFKALRTVAEPKLIIETYKALGECLLRYCICAWGSATKTNLIVVERAQRAVLKVLMFLPFRHPTTSVYETTKVLSVRKLFIFESLRRYHKRIVPSFPESKKRIQKCPVPFVITTFAKRQFDVVVPHLYNTLDIKSKVKKYSNHEIKRIILSWLETFDYESIEKMLSDFRNQI